jgi:hypothetical protein
MLLNVTHKLICKTSVSLCGKQDVMTVIAFISAVVPDNVRVLLLLLLLLLMMVFLFCTEQASAAVVSQHIQEAVGLNPGLPSILRFCYSVLSLS